MQTKLSKPEKVAVRTMIADFDADGGLLFSFDDIGLTLAITWPFHGASNARVGVSWKGDAETKFRRLVGAMHAIERAEWNAFPVPVQRAFAADFATEFHAMFKIKG